MWTENSLKWELFDNDGVTIKSRDFRDRVFLKHEYKLAGVIAFLNSSSVEWTEKIGCVFRVKSLLKNSSGLVWTGPKWRRPFHWHMTCSFLIGCYFCAKAHVHVITNHRRYMDLRRATSSMWNFQSYPFFTQTPVEWVMTWMRQTEKQQTCFFHWLAVL